MLSYYSCPDSPVLSKVFSKATQQGASLVLTGFMERGVPFWLRECHEAHCHRNCTKNFAVHMYVFEHRYTYALWDPSLVAIAPLYIAVSFVAHSKRYLRVQPRDPAACTTSRSHRWIISSKMALSVPFFSHNSLAKPFPMATCYKIFLIVSMRRRRKTKHNELAASLYCVQ